MNLLYYSPFARIEIHRAASCDLLSALHAQGHRLNVLFCDRTYGQCFDNQGGSPRVCSKCVASQHSMQAWLAGQGIPYRALRLADWLPPPEELERLAAPCLAWTDEVSLRAVTHRGRRVGLASLGTLITLERETRPDLVRWRPWIDDGIRRAIGVLEAVLRIQQELGIEGIHLFNGRIAECAGAMWAAEERGIPFWVNEAGTRHDRYSLYPGASPHHPWFVNALVDAQYARLQRGEVPAADIEAAEAWFLRRQGGALIDGRDYLRDQKRGTLPADFERHPRNIAVFLGSRDEYVCLPAWDLPFLESQEAGIDALARRLAPHGVHVYVRIHPNLRGIDNHQTRDIEALRRHPNVTLIAADSPVSTYALAQATSLNLSFGSTVGVEALFMGKPSLLIGPSYYATLPAILKPSSLEETLDLVLRAVDARLPFDRDDARRGALAYALWVLGFGQTFRHFEVAENFEVRALGDLPFGQEEYRVELHKRIARYLRNPALERRKNALLRHSGRQQG